MDSKSDWYLVTMNHCHQHHRRGSSPDSGLTNQGWESCDNQILINLQPVTWDTRNLFNENLEKSLKASQSENNWCGKSKAGEAGDNWLHRGDQTSRHKEKIFQTKYFQWWGGMVLGFEFSRLGPAAL